MSKDEDESDADGRPDAVCICRPPGHAGHEEEERQKVCESRIRSMVGVFGFCRHSLVAL